MKVFLDTNVLVSAHATRGLCRDVLRLVLAEHTFVTADVVLSEFERILATKFKVPLDVVRDIIEPLRDHHVEPRPDSVGAIEVRDPDDAWVLASAIAAGAEVVVTGDPDLLVIADATAQLQILNPRAFWDLHRQP